MTKEREKLPGIYEKKYRSEILKHHITDAMMWPLVPGVDYAIHNKEGVKRLKENDTLFTFIDQYFPDKAFAFEPNMRDGRFVFLPDNVEHQGIGVMVSKNLPGTLEIGHFWYPGEYSDYDTEYKPFEQVYVPQFCMMPNDGLASFIEGIYFPKKPHRTKLCTFPFNNQCVVTLKGNFLDHLKSSEKTIRDGLIDQSPEFVKKGEELIKFMRRITA